MYQFSTLLNLLTVLTTFEIHPTTSKHVAGEAVNNTLTIGFLMSWTHEWASGKINDIGES